MEQALFIATVAAVLIALIEVFKRTGLNERWAPLVAVLLGVGAAFAAASQAALASPDPFTTALTGLARLNVPRSDIPAVTHLDYSARLQTVSKNLNAGYHAVIDSFKKLTGGS